MHWIIIGVTFAICVALNLTHWPRKKLARLQELAEADFEKRKTEASAPCGEHPFHLSLYEFANGSPSRFIATYKTPAGQAYQFRFGIDDRPLLREQFAALARDPELDLTWTDVWKIDRFMVSAMACIAQQKFGYKPFVDALLGKIFKAINDTKGDAA